ncbi:MAG: GAF domain-containing protein [Anaerolineales bacterium]|nr:GAF domain-containing protein [Anaerolineales bacterium]
MPKKKPAAKRLDKLFQNITPEDTSSKPARKAPLEEALIVPPPVAPEQVRTVSPPTRPVELIQRAPASTRTISMPFQAGQNNWATLQVLDDKPETQWTPDDELLVRQVVDQLSLALENARLFQETELRAKEMSVLNEMGQALAATLNIEQIIEITYAGISRLFDTRNFYIAFYDQPKNEIVFPRNVSDSIADRSITRIPMGTGITTHIIRARESVLITDGSDNWMRQRGETPVGEPAQSFLGVPLVASDTVLGAIAIQDYTTPKKYDEHDLRLLTSFASQAAIAIENARLFEEAQRRAQETSALAEVGREISSSLQLETVLEKIASYAFDLLQATTSAAYLPIEQGEKWRAVAAVGSEAKELQGDLVIRGRGILGNAILQASGAIFNNAENISEGVLVQGTEPVPAFEHLMAVPVLSNERATGLLAVWREGEGREFKPTELDFLTSLSRQTAIAIANAQLFQEATSSQATLSEALRIARIGYFEVDAATQTISITDELLAILDTTAEKEGGRQLPARRVLRKFVHPDDYKSAIAAYIKAFKSGNTGQEVAVETRYRLRDGRTIWVNTTYKAELDEKGRVYKVAGSSQDITDRKTNELVQTAITQISDATLTAASIEELIRAIHAAIGKLVPAKNFYIALYDTQADWMTFPYYEDEHDQPMPPQKLGRGLTSYVIRTGRALRTTPELYAELVASGEVVGGGTTSVDWLGIPLRSETAVRGVMAVQSYNSAERITKQHQDILSILGTQVAAAIERLLSRQALAKSEADLRALFSSMQDVVLVVDQDTRYVRIAPTNPSRLFRPPEELLGKRMDELLPPETHEPIRAAIHKALESNESVQIEYRLPIEDQEYWFLANISRLNKNEVFWVARDITERKRSEEALQRRNKYLAISAEIGKLVTSTLDLNRIFTETVNSVKDGFELNFASIYNIEETGFNAMLRGATGEAGEQLIAEKHSVAVGSQSIVGLVAESGTARLIEDVDSEPLYQPHPLLTRTRSEVAIPLRIGQRIIAVLDLHSDRASAFTEDDISVLQLLSDQVAVAIDNARSYELSQQLIKDLREVDKLKSQFLANMSHELRTPLNSIIGFSRVILKGIDGPITDMQQQDLTAIYNSGQHLLGLINDVLDLARIEAGKMELNFEEVNLADMIQSVLSTAKGLVKEKPIQLVSNIAAGTPTVRGDTMRVRQVFINLLSNASKFTDEGAIKVEAQNQKDADGKTEVLIRVTDTGPGISIEDQEKLFKAFSQVDGSATRKSGGTGLGLSICANLVQLHGGRIGVESEPGKGSTFWFTLQPYHQQLDEIPADRKVVIAIDDDPKVVSLYERYLTPQGYYVIPFIDAKGAKERIIAIKPHAITLDVMMPNVDGWTLLSDLKSDPATRDIPVIVCSILEQADKGFNLGAADYLTKPILEEDLVQAMQRLDKKGQIRNILVIDDSPDDRRLIEKILGANGKYEVVSADGGRQGWEAIKANPPQAVILDLFMPDWDGFAVLEKLREDPVLRDLPVLVVSGGGLTEEQSKQLQDFGKRLLLKGSFKEGELITSIEHALDLLG